LSTFRSNRGAVREVAGTAPGRFRANSLKKIGDPECDRFVGSDEIDGFVSLLRNGSPLTGSVFRPLRLPGKILRAA
jgi:hypothetical protein